MSTINPSWYTREDRVSPLTLKFTKEQRERDQERDQNMAKITAQIEIFRRNVMGACPWGVNVMGVWVYKSRRSQL